MTKKAHKAEGSEQTRLIVAVVGALIVAGGFYTWTRMEKLQNANVPVVAAPTPKLQAPRSLEDVRHGGPVIVYYDNGKVKSERNFKDGKLEGPYKVYYDSGVLKEEGSY